MDYDATQALALSDFDDETDEEIVEGEKKEVAHLKVLCQPGFPLTLFPIYEGINLIGRDGNVCNVHIATQALSKQHACIEVQGKTHLIYDKKSKNKTKRDQLYLSPEVRYELKHGDKITLADLSCEYFIVDCVKEKQANNNNQDQSGEVGDSDPSSDILMPTQPYHEDGGGPKAFALGGPTLNYVEDSDPEDEVDNPFADKGNESDVVIGETPMAARTAASTQYIPDSDSETTDGEQERERLDFDSSRYSEQDIFAKPGQENQSDIPTQEFLMDDEADSDATVEEEETGGEKPNAEAPTQVVSENETQVYPLEVSPRKSAMKKPKPKPEEEEGISSETDAATQKFSDDAGKTTPKRISWDATLAVEDSEEEPAPKADDETQVFGDGDATQPVSALTGADAETQMIDPPSSPILATSAAAEAETQVIDVFKSPSKPAGRGRAAASMGEATQIISPDPEEATQVIDVFKSPSKPAGKSRGRAAASLGEATQILCPGEETQILTDGTPTLNIRTKPTMVARKEARGLAGPTGESTQIIGEATQIIGDSTQIIGDTQELEQETQILTDNTQITPVLTVTRTPSQPKRDTQRESTFEFRPQMSSTQIRPTSADESTQVATPESADSDATQTYDDPPVLKIASERNGDDESTQVYDDKTPDEEGTLNFDMNLTETTTADDTSPIKSSPSASKPQQDNTQATQVYDESQGAERLSTSKPKQDNTQATQVYNDSEETVRPSPSKSQQESSQATQVYNDSEETVPPNSGNVATQVYGDSEPNDQLNLDLAPTQTYGDEETKEPANSDLVATQVYSEAASDRPENPDEVETQAYGDDDVSDAESEDLIRGPPTDTSPPAPVPEKPAEQPVTTEPADGAKTEDVINKSASDDYKAQEQKEVSPETAGRPGDYEATQAYKMDIDSDATVEESDGETKKTLQKKDPAKENQEEQNKEDTAGPSGGPAGDYEPTQAYVMEVDSDATVEESDDEASRKKKQESKSTPKEKKKIEDKEETSEASTGRPGDYEATQAYGLEPDVAGTSRGPSGDYEATQAYGLEPEEDEDEKVEDSDEDTRRESAVFDDVDTQEYGEITSASRVHMPGDVVASSQLEDDATVATNLPDLGIHANKGKGKSKSKRESKGSSKDSKTKTKGRKSVQASVTPEPTPDPDPVPEEKEVQPKRAGRRKSKKLVEPSAAAETSEAKPEAEEPSPPSSTTAKTSRRTNAKKITEAASDIQEASNSEINNSSDEPQARVVDMKPPPAPRGRPRKGAAKEAEAKPSRRTSRVNKNSKVEEEDKSVASSVISEGGDSSQGSRRSARSTSGERASRRSSRRGDTSRDPSSDTESVTSASSESQTTRRRGRKAAEAPQPEPAPETTSRRAGSRGRKPVEEPVSEAESTESSTRGRRKRGVVKEEPGEEVTEAPPTKRGRQTRGKVADTEAGEAEESKPPAAAGRGKRASGRGRGRPSAVVNIKTEPEDPPTETANNDAASNGADDDADFEEPVVKPRGRRATGKGKATKPAAPTIKVEEPEPGPSNVETEEQTNSKKRKTSGRGKGKVAAVAVKEEPVTDLLDPGTSATSGRKKRASSPQSSVSSQELSQAAKRRRSAPVSAPSTPRTPGNKRASIAGSQDVCSPSLRKRVLPVKVMFTGVVDEKGSKIVKALGGELADSIESCTHLVTDKVRRTVKFLCGLARGIHIVDIHWIEACKEAKTFIDCEPYTVNDPKTEIDFKFKLKDSIEVASEHRVFTGWKIHVTKSTKPTPLQMKEIVGCAGGKIVGTMPKKYEDNCVVVSCTDDEGLWKPAISAKIPIVSVEFILTGILRQEANTTEHALHKETGANSDGGETSKRKGRKK